MTLCAVVWLCLRVSIPDFSLFTSLERGQAENTQGMQGAGLYSPPLTFAGESFLNYREAGCQLTLPLPCLRTQRP